MVCENSSVGPSAAVTSWHPATPLRSVSSLYQVTQQTRSSMPSLSLSNTSGGASPNPLVALNDQISDASFTSIPTYSAPSPLLPPSMSVGMVMIISAPAVPSSSATTGPGNLMWGESVLPSRLFRVTPPQLGAPLAPSRRHTHRFPSSGSMVVSNTAEFESSIFTHAGSDGISPWSRLTCHIGVGAPPAGNGNAKTTTCSFTSLTSE